MKNIVILGPPGSGKGTQAKKIAEKQHMVHISTGEIFRYNLKNNTDLGQKAQLYISKGELVPDDITEAMLMDRLKQCDCLQGFILDGFPRTIHQAQSLDNILNNLSLCLSMVIYINVEDGLLIERLTSRLVCDSCQVSFNLLYSPPKIKNICDKCGGDLYRRNDDNKTTIQNRLQNFHRKTEALISYYRKQKKIFYIDGSRSPLEVCEQIYDII